MPIKKMKKDLSAHSYSHYVDSHKTAAAPNPIHALFMFNAPVFINHLRAEQCGAPTVKGDVTNPVNVIGVHNLTYTCGAMKCAAVHPMLEPSKNAPFLHLVVTAVVIPEVSYNLFFKYCSLVARLRSRHRHPVALH